MLAGTGLAQGRVAACAAGRKRGWTVVDMKTDWKQAFASGQSLRTTEPLKGKT
jgi:hypothetical protein